MLPYPALVQFLSKRSIAGFIELFPGELWGYASVSSDDAEVLLEQNVRNRKTQKAYIRNIKNDILARNWVRMPIPIIFDSSGILLDGQHRLFSIVESGESVLSLFCLGVSNQEHAHDVSRLLDTGKSRGVADQVGIVGSDKIRDRVTSQHATISFLVLRVQMQSAKGVDSNNIFGVSSYSTLEKQAFLEDHFEAIDFAYQFRDLSKKALPATALAPLAKAYYVVDKDKLYRFGEVLATGVSRDLSEDKILLTRDFILQKKNVKVNGVFRTPRREEQYAIVQTALYKYLSGKQVKRTSRLNRDLFPW